VIARLVLAPIFTALVVAAGPAQQAGRPQASPPIIPAPVSVTPGTEVFRFDHATGVHVAHPAFATVVHRQLEALRTGTGLRFAETEGASAPVRVASDSTIVAEGYRLVVTASGIDIAAPDEAGVFYAFQTLRQLLPAEIEALDPPTGVEWTVRAVAIEDAPRFGYRGMHLDVGRHFFDVEFVKRFIDTIARFKLNRFHWHLTEDQGWRVEIDAFPRLTEFGAWRTESPAGRQADPYVGDGVRHGGFYTKDEIRDVVAYAAERFVTVIPEIEMPGHSTAAIASYPELGCTDERLDVSTRWGVHSTILCPSEETFRFLETVLTEVMELFPSDVIHIGGDEVPKRAWQESALAQEVMGREGLADEDELQSWFIRRIEPHLRASGRRLMGWDEILEGGLAPDAIVMSWRGMEGGIEAARQGHDVVMAPIQHAYFDFYQGDIDTEPLAMNWAGFPITLETAYAFEPVPPELTAEEARHVLGAQGNLWTEYIATPEYAEYMAYPRALALAEVAWSPREARDWSDFVGRLRVVLPRLDALGINYRPQEELNR
jgi:hexosaminidase